MNSVTKRAYAKINLALNVFAKRSDEYHDVDMIMTSIDLFDVVTVSKTKQNSSISITSDSEYLPLNEKNIAVKAANAFFDYAKIDNRNINIDITKFIPIAAGLAGGSSDGASVITALNEMYQTAFSVNELCEIGKRVGADVPYCIMGTTMRAQGIGEILTPVNSRLRIPILLVKPSIGVSTQWAYDYIDGIIGGVSEKNPIEYADIDEIIKNIEHGCVKKLAKSMVNSFEAPISSRHKTIYDIKRKMLECGSLGAIMSGSGPSVFGIFDSFQKAKQASKFFRMGGYECFVVMSL